MALVSLKEILADARKRNYAVPMFDVTNVEMMRQVIRTAEDLRAPVMFGAIPSDVAGENLDYWCDGAFRAALSAKIPVCIHLDHAANLEQIIKCADKGFSGVMIDASIQSFEKNVEITKEVCDAMHRRGISVEAELGHVATGKIGYGGNTESGENADSEPIFTDPAEAAKFIELTGADALAVSIGTAHGVYDTAPELQIGRLAEIRKACDVPLVLHGGSGTPDDQVAQAVENGICKINIYSELCIAWNTAIRDMLNNQKTMSCWVCKGLSAGMEAMIPVLERKIKLFKAEGKA